jgi:hypothetical protein
MLTKGDVLKAMGKIKSAYGSAEKMYNDPLGPSGKRASEVCPFPSSPRLYLLPSSPLPIIPSFFIDPLGRNESSHFDVMRVKLTHSLLLPHLPLLRRKPH